MSTILFAPNLLVTRPLKFYLCSKLILGTTISISFMVKSPRFGSILKSLAKTLDLKNQFRLSVGIGTSAPLRTVLSSILSKHTPHILHYC